MHFPRHVDRDELARAGALGLVEAARRYDEDRGVPFERFAAQRIRGAILDAVRAADWAPRSVRNLARKLEGAEQRLATELGRVPNKEEMSEALGMSQSELNRLQDSDVPLRRAGARTRDRRRRREGPDAGRRARRRAARSSRRPSSRPASSTATSATPSRCCPSVTASWWSATSSRVAPRRSSPTSSVSPSPASASSAPSRC